MRQKLAALLSAGSLIIAATAGAQLRAGGEKIEVRLVEVPVNVTAADGTPVRGLTAANFELYDEGRKQVITNFDTVDFGSPQAKRSAFTIPASGRRNFLLLFDTTNSAPASLLRGRRAALQFLETQLVPGDRVGVASLNAQRGFRLLAGFTTDRTLARQAIETLGVPKFYQPRDPLLLSASDMESGKNQATFDGPSSEARADVEEMFKDLAAGQQRLTNEAQRQLITRELDDVAALGRALDRVAGRKQVILLSEGFDPKALQGRKELNSASAWEDRTNAEHGEIWRVDTDNLYGNTSAGSDLQNMIQSLRRSDVVLHAIDIKGLRTDVDTQEGLKSVSNDALYLLTRDTGGTVFKNSNDLSQNFARLMQLQQLTYTLAFQTHGIGAGTFHRLKVKLVGVPGAHLTYRIGYYEPSMAESELDRTLTAGDIITNSLPADDVKFTPFAAALPRATNAEVPVILEIDGNDLLENVTAKILPAEIFVYAFDREEKIRDFLYQRVTFDLTKLRDRLRAHGVKYYGALGLPPGDYSLRILVRAAGQRNGFQSMALHVPGPSEHYIAPPMLFDDLSSGWIMLRSERAAAEYPFQVGEADFVPAVLPVLKAGQNYRIALFTYNVPVEGMRLVANIEGEGGKVNVPLSLIGRTSADANGGVKLLFNLAPPELAHGAYSLIVGVRERDASAENRIKLPFEVN